MESKRIIVPRNSDTEADTCRKEVTPRLYASEWTDEQILEQRTFTDGKIIILGKIAKRQKPKKADYILRLGQNFPIAVIEAKKKYKSASDGLQQAREYAETLGCPFAYATNGTEIVEFDFVTGTETVITSYPTPHELWNRFQTSRPIQDNVKEILLKPLSPNSGKSPRYYQEIAVNRAVQSILENRKRLLLTLATGTGKTSVAFQIIYKLWNNRWNTTGEHRRPKILFLADRKVLWMTPMQKTLPSLAMPVHRFLTTVPPPVAKSTFPRISHWQKVKPEKDCSGSFRTTFLIWWSLMSVTGAAPPMTATGV